MFEFSPIILEHFYQATHMGVLDEKKAEVLSARVGDYDTTCIMHLYLQIDPIQRKILIAKFKVYGCVAAIATMDWLCELLIEKCLWDIKLIDAEFIAQQLQLAPQKYYCALMAEELLASFI